MHIFKSESDILDCFFFFKEWIAKLNDKISNITVLCFVVHKLGSSYKGAEYKHVKESFFFLRG